MRKTTFGALTTLLVPFAAYGFNGAYGGYGALQRRQTPHVVGQQRTAILERPHAFVGETTGSAEGSLMISTGSPVRELLVIDAAVPDKQVLYRALRPGMDVVEISGTEPGLAQLSDVLARHSNLEALHIVSHAQDGVLLLGNSRISAESIKQEVEAFAALEGALREGADLLLYGCDLAASDAGVELLDIIHRRTRRDVAASNDKTGAEHLHGDWDLEIRRGSIETQSPFSAKALKDFSAVLAVGDGTKDFSSGWTDNGDTLTSTGFIVGARDGVSGQSLDVSIYEDPPAAYIMNGDSADSYFYVYADGVDTGSFELTALSSGEYDAEFTNVRIVGILPDDSEITSTTLNGTSTPEENFDFSAAQLGDFAGVQLKGFKLHFHSEGGVPDVPYFEFRDFTIANAQNPPDTDGDLTAAAGVSEPVGLGSTVDTAGEAVDVFDFTLSDGGSNDGKTLDVTEIRVQVSGSSSNAERSQISWLLNGPDASAVSGNYDSGSGTLTFPGLDISVANGGSETYTISAYFNDTGNLGDGSTVILSIDGASDVSVVPGSTRMGPTTPVSNGSGSSIEVEASRLVFSTQPAGAVSGSALTTQPVVTAQDEFGNVDVDFSETITLSSAPGSLSDATQAASNGVATFSGLTYDATADQESVTLTANDQDGVGGNLPTVDAVFTADVVATGLQFSTEPAPVTLSSGAATSFSTVPVVSAVDADGIVDTDYATSITLSVVNGAGSALMSAAGDGDGDPATVSIAPSNGVASFDGLQITYTNGGLNDTFNLRASSGALSSAESTELSSVSGPRVSAANIGVSGATGSGGTYRIGDTVTVTWDNTASGDDNDGVMAVTIDFSAFGGDPAVAATESGGVWTATQVLDAGVIDASNLNVSVSASDANGSTTVAGTSNASVDSAAPSVSDGNINLSGASGNGGVFIANDTVTAAWNDSAAGENNSDTISAVSFDFSAFGGDAAVPASNAAGIWSASYTLPAGSLDATGLNVIATVTDDAGNSSSAADSSNASVDTFAPVVTGSVPAATPASALSVVFTVTFDDTVVGLSTDDFVLSATGTALGSVASVSVTSGDSADVTVNVSGGIGTLRLDTTGTGITDQAGNPVPAYSGGTSHSVNTAPALSVDTSPLSYETGSQAIRIAADATLSDPNGDTDWDGGSLSVQITANSAPDDELSLVDDDGDAPAITIAGTQLLADGVPIGSLSSSGGVVNGDTALVITFNADATNASVQEVLQSLRFRNSSASPSMAARTLTIVSTDRNGHSATVTRAISFRTTSGSGGGGGGNGVIDDYTPNPVGVINNPVITPTGTVEGGTLGGTVRNSGTIRDVELVPGTHVEGGTLSGSIEGSPESPARINNATISGDAELSNVVISQTTVLEPGARIGPNVKFESSANIPGGIDLTEALPTINWTDADRRGVVGLDADVVAPLDGSDPMTLIRSIQLLGEYEPAGNSVTQESNGELLIITADSSSALLPVKVSQAREDEPEGTYINEDGDIVFVTVNRRVVLAYPALQDKPGLVAALASYGLVLNYDERANLIASPPGSSAALLYAGSADRQALALEVEDSGYYAARPEASALPAPAGVEPGVHYAPIPGLPGSNVIKLVFRDEEGALMVQDVVPVPADWELMKASLQGQGFDEVRIDSQGIISVRYKGTLIQGRSEYRVNGGAIDLAEADRVAFVPAGDLDGNGTDDFLMVFPNGDSQRLFILPELP